MVSQATNNRHENKMVKVKGSRLAAQGGERGGGRDLQGEKTREERDAELRDESVSLDD